MADELAGIKGPYFRDILDQGRVLQATADGLETTPQLSDLVAKLRSAAFSRIVLTGMGASFSALYPLQIQLVDGGLHAVIEETSELLHYKARLLDADTLVIAVSQSGRSAEIVRLVEAAANRATVLGVTNTPGSPLAVDAAAAVFTRAGEEFSVSCKTYTATLAALSWVGELLTGGDHAALRTGLLQTAKAVAAYVNLWDEHVRELRSMIDDTDNLFLTGRGPSLAAVSAGSLIIKESTHVAAEGVGSAAFRHGPFEMVGPRTLVLVFAGPQSTRRLNFALARDIRDRGGRAALVAVDAEVQALRLPSAPDAALPIIEILPVQMLTLALGVRAGREPGRFTFLSKVTTVE